MNVKLLRKVKKHILAEPKRLYMSSYIRTEGCYELSGDRIPKCGTAACIAGWTCILSMPKKNPVDILFSNQVGEKAAEILGITYDQGSLLFEPSEWPEKFDGGLSDDGTKKTAKMAAARIEHFIKTKGRE